MGADACAALGFAVEHPQIGLQGFRHVHLEPGAVNDVTMPLTPPDLEYWHTAASERPIEKEPIRILVGGSNDKLPVRATFRAVTEGSYKP